VKDNLLVCGENGKMRRGGVRNLDRGRLDDDGTRMWRGVKELEASFALTLLGASIIPDCLFSLGENLSQIDTAEKGVLFES
jgi:hypothetical protein